VVGGLCIGLPADRSLGLAGAQVNTRAFHEEDLPMSSEAGGQRTLAGEAPSLVRYGLSERARSMTVAAL